MGKEFYSPPSPEEVKKQLLSLRAGFPRVRVFSAGRSSQGRDIPALLAGSPHGAALFVAGAAAGEGMATRILLRFSRDLLLAAGENAALTEINAAKALENRGVFVIPQLNPDGAALRTLGPEEQKSAPERILSLCGGDLSRWQANSRGVDLRAQFPAGWRAPEQKAEKDAPSAPAPEGFGGYRPLSEPESRGLAALARAGRIRHCLSFREGRGALLFRGGENTPPRARLMAELLARAAGYRVSSAPLESGSFPLWFVEAFRRPAFQLSIGGGRSFCPKEEELLYRRLLETMMTGLLL